MCKYIVSTDSYLLPQSTSPTKGPLGPNQSQQKKRQKDIYFIAPPTFLPFFDRRRELLLLLPPNAQVQPRRLASFLNVQEYLFWPIIFLGLLVRLRQQTKYKRSNKTASATPNTDRLLHLSTFTKVTYFGGTLQQGSSHRPKSLNRLSPSSDDHLRLVEGVR